ncbi:myosin light chain kinase, smooth muscle-like [Leptodactylus fuscus]
MADVRLASSPNIAKTPMIGKSPCLTSILPRAAPAFILPPRNSRVSVGSTARIDGKVGGSPDPQVTWYRCGHPVVSGGRCTVEQSTRGTFCLTIRDVTAEDSGKYTCEAANEEGVRQVTVQLTVEGSSAMKYSLPSSSRSAGSPFAVPPIENRPSIWGESPPKFVTKLSRVVVKEGQTGRFSFKVTGRPPPAATWSKDEVELQSGERYNVYDKAGVYSLEILRACKEDVGMYTCTMTNSCGSSAASAELIIQGCDWTDGSPGLRSSVTSTNKMAITSQVDTNGIRKPLRGVDKTDPSPRSSKCSASSTKDDSSKTASSVSSASSESRVSIAKTETPGRFGKASSPPLLDVDSSGTARGLSEGSVKSSSYTKPPVTSSTKDSPSIVSRYTAILESRTSPSREPAQEKSACLQRRPQVGAARIRAASPPGVQVT